MKLDAAELALKLIEAEQDEAAMLVLMASVQQYSQYAPISEQVMIFRGESRDATVLVQMYNEQTVLDLGQLFMMHGMLENGFSMRHSFKCIAAISGCGGLEDKDMNLP